eukprot:363761-Chlamydomonas_euryale.AAC.12
MGMSAGEACASQCLLHWPLCHSQACCQPSRLTATPRTPHRTYGHHAPPDVALPRRHHPVAIGATRLQLADAVSSGADTPIPASPISGAAKARPLGRSATEGKPGRRSQLHATCVAEHDRQQPRANSSTAAAKA